MLIILEIQPNKLVLLWRPNFISFKTCQPEHPQMNENNTCRKKKKNPKEGMEKTKFCSVFYYLFILFYFCSYFTTLVLQVWTSQIILGKWKNITPENKYPKIFSMVMIFKNEYLPLTLHMKSHLFFQSFLSWLVKCGIFLVLKNV